ncbi:HAMP domain-containing protein [Candidatus Auribacterota bacterium]
MKFLSGFKNLISAFISSGLQKRLLAYIIISGTIVVIIVLAVFLRLESKHYERVIGRHHNEIASLLAESFDKFIKDILRDTDTVMESGKVIGQVIDSDKKHYGRSKADILKETIKLSSQWALNEGKNPFAEDLMNSAASSYLIAYIGDKEKIFKGVLITDEAGWLVAATQRVEDFYHANEKWWQEGYNYGKGKDYISGIEQDESVGSAGLTIARPIHDYENKVIGVAKFILHHEYINQIVQSARAAKNSQITVVDSEGKVLLDSVLIPGTLDSKFESNVVDSLKRYSAGGYCVGANILKSDSIIGYHPISNVLLDRNEKRWYVLSSQTIEKAFAPLRIFIIYSGFIMLVSLGILFLVGIVIANRFSLPILKLKNTAERIARGDLSERVNIRTGDEIERIGGLFNEMAELLNNREHLLGCRVSEISEICDIGKSIAFKRDFDEVIDGIIGIIVENRDIRSDAIAVSIYGADYVKNVFSRRIQTGFIEAAPEIKMGSVDDEIMTHVVENKNVLSVQDVDSNAVVKEFLKSTYGNKGIYSVYIYPLLSKSGFLGMMIITGMMPLRLTGDEETVLRIISEMISLGVENEKLFKDMFEKHWEMYWMHEAAILISSITDLEVIVAGMAKIMMASCKAERIVFVPVLDKLGLGKKGFGYEIFGQSRSVIGDDHVGLLKKYVSSRKSFKSPNEFIDIESQVLMESPVWKQFKKSVVSNIVVPIFHPENRSMLGVFFIFSERTGVFTEERDLKLLNTYSQYVSKAFNNYLKYCSE